VPLAHDPVQLRRAGGEVVRSRGPRLAHDPMAQGREQGTQGRPWGPREGIGFYFQGCVQKVEYRARRPTLNSSKANP
jgi:hypothetical protein